MSKSIAHIVWVTDEIYVACETRELAEKWIATSGFPASIYYITEIEYLGEEDNGD